MESDPGKDELESSSPQNGSVPEQETAPGSDRTFMALEDEYARLRADLVALAYEIKHIRGLRVEELSKSIKKRRFRLLQLEKQIFESRQMKLFPESTIRRQKRPRASKTQVAKLGLDEHTGAKADF